MVEVSVLGISLQQSGDTPYLLLFPHKTRSILSLAVGALEAFAISAALSETVDLPEKEKQIEKSLQDARIGAEMPEHFSRSTHQLLQKSIQSLGGRLASVEISRDKTQELACALLLRGPQGEKRLDCHPADGITLAVRCHAQVRITPELAARAKDIETVMPTLSEDLRTVVAAKLLSLRDDEGLLPVRDTLLRSALNTTQEHLRKATEDLSLQLFQHGTMEGPLSKILSDAVAKLGGASSENKGPKVTATMPVRRNQAEQRGSIHSVPAPKASVTPAASKQTGQTGQRDGNATVEAVVVPGQTIVLPSPQGGEKSPTIRISLVRQSPESTAEAIGEPLFPDTDIAKEALSGLSLSRDEIRAVRNASSNEDGLATLLRLLSPETKVPM